jgi:subtilisin family serine protease
VSEPTGSDRRARAWWEDREVQRSRLRGQVEHILDRRSDAAAVTGDADDLANTEYIHRDGVILLRDTDLDRVSAVVPGEVEASLINGLTAYRPASGGTLAALAIIDAQLGVGVASPDHVLHITPAAGACPATEPELPEPGVDRPHPDVNPDPLSDGTGVLVSVVDTGYIRLQDDGEHPWLDGVQGDLEEYDTHDIGLYTGHGTFVAGIVRCLAPKAAVRVEGFLTHGGAIFESEIVTQLDQALNHVPDIINLAAGTSTRNNLGLLGFEVFWESRLKYYKGTVLVAAAGNDMDRGPFWPAAFPWAVSVGALDGSDNRAPFSNYGSWVDVYARGVDLINAYPNGTYTYREPPLAGASVKFTTGLAQWSGTSFATPIVSGLIAARMSRTGESGRRAADAILDIARRHAKPRVGAIAKPGMSAAD